MFTVQLAIYAGSRARNTNARCVFSRRAKMLEQSSPTDGPIWSCPKIVWYIKVRYQSTVAAAVRIPSSRFRRRRRFVSAHAYTLCILFWVACCSMSLRSGPALPLGDGSGSSQYVPVALDRVRITPHLSKSLASGYDSWRSEYEAWQAGTLERSELAEFATSSRSSLGKSWRILSNTSSYPSTSTSVPTVDDMADVLLHTSSLKVRSRTPGSSKRPPSPPRSH